MVKTWLWECNDAAQVGGHRTGIQLEQISRIVDVNTIGVPIPNRAKMKPLRTYYWIRQSWDFF
jgi:hypothetical protein